MKLSVPRSSAYNLASGTQSGAGAGWRGPRGLGNTSLYDHCPQCRVLATRPHRDIYRPAAAALPPLVPRPFSSGGRDLTRDFHRIRSIISTLVSVNSSRWPRKREREREAGGNRSMCSIMMISRDVKTRSVENNVARSRAESFNFRLDDRAVE